MYDPGKGIYSEVSGSLHNIPMHMQDNGRVAPQVMTPGQVRIHNPAISMGTSELNRNMAAYGAPMDPRGHSGPLGYYQTQIHNAAMYSTLAAEKSARTQRDSMKSYKDWTGFAQVGLALVGGLNPFALAAQGALMVGENFLGSGEEYYKGFQNRSADIQGIKSVMANTGPSMINNVTGRVSNSAAMSYLNMMPGMASGLGMTSSDLHGINTMAAQSGLMQGHGGSINQLGSRLRQISKMTKHLMDISSGITAQDAMEIQRLAQDMDISGSKFDTMNFGRRLITAAKISGRSVAQVGAVMQQGSAMSQQFGLGTAVGADVALFNDTSASSMYGNLSVAQRRKVGSQAQFANTLNAAHLRFAATNAQNLVGQSVYVDPTTGNLEIDDADVEGFTVGRKAHREALRRTRRIFSGDNATRLSKAGISTKFVKSIVNVHSQELAATAAENMDPERRMELMLKGAMAESHRLKMDPRAYLIMKHGKKEADAIMVQADQFQKGAAARTMDQYKQNLEYHVSAAAAGVPEDAPEVTDSERLGRITASLSASLSERAQEEALGIFRTKRNRDLSISQFDVNSKFRRRRRATGGLMDYSLGAATEHKILSEGNVEDLNAARSGRDFSKTILGSYFLDRSRRLEDSWFDLGIRAGFASDATSAFGGDIGDMSDEDIEVQARRLERVDPQAAVDLRAMAGFVGGSSRMTVGKLRSRRDISGTLRDRLKNLDQKGQITRRNISEFAISRRSMGDLRAANLFDQTRASAGDIIDNEKNRQLASRMDRAVGLIDNAKASDLGMENAALAAMEEAGINTSGFDRDKLLRSFMARVNQGVVKGAEELSVGMSDLFNKTRMLGGLGTGASFEFNAKESLGGRFDKYTDKNGRQKLIQDLKEGNLSFAKVRRTALLFEGDVDINAIDEATIEDRLLSFSRASKMLGGTRSFQDILKSAGSDAFHKNLENPDTMSLNQLVSRLKSTGKLSIPQKKALDKLVGSGDEKSKQSLRRAILGSVTAGSTKGGKGSNLLNQLVGQAADLVAAGDNTRGNRILEGFREDLKDTGFEGIFGGKGKLASVSQLRESVGKLHDDTRLKNSYDKFMVGSGDVAAGLAELGVNFKALNERQQDQVESLFRHTVGSGGGKTGLDQFRKELFKIIESSGKVKGKTGGGARTAEDATMQTIRSFNDMIGATAEMLKALTLPEAEAQKALKSAKDRLSAIASQAAAPQ
jgi:hypothetical protein